MSSESLFVALERAREVQRSTLEVRSPRTGKKIYLGAPNATAPDYCFAAAKFVAGKLAGLFRENSHLNDLVLNRARANGKDRIPPGEMKTAWGLFSGKDSFNNKILDASLKPEAGIINNSWELLEKPRFWFASGNRFVDQADQLLNQGVPLVVGVSLHGLGKRDHFVCVVKHRKEGSTWLIDSWEDRSATTPGVFRLKSGFSFKKPEDLATDASTTTKIPCDQMFLGYYLGEKSSRPFTAVEFDADSDPSLIRAKEAAIERSQPLA